MGQKASVSATAKSMKSAKSAKSEKSKKSKSSPHMPTPSSFDECPDISGGWSTLSPVNSYVSVLAGGKVINSKVPYLHALDLSNFAGTTCAFNGRAFGASPDGEGSSDPVKSDPVNGAFAVSSSDAAPCFTVTWLLDPDNVPDSISIAIEGRGCVTDNPDVINFAFTTTSTVKGNSVSTFTARMQLHRKTEGVESFLIPLG